MADWTDSAGYQAAFGSREAIQLTDKATPPAGAVDEAVMVRALNEAEAVVGALLRRRYPDFPTPAIPGAVKDKTYHVARYFLFDTNVPDTVRTNYEDALAFLDRAVFTPEELGLTAADAPGPAASAAPTKAIKYGADFRSAYDYMDPAA